MSYIDGRDVPGSHSTKTVWLRYSGGVVGIDFDELNAYIDEYNRSRLSVNFWYWFNWTAPIDVDVRGFSVLWNHNNSNMRFVHSIRGMNA